MGLPEKQERKVSKLWQMGLTTKGAPMQQAWQWLKITLKHLETLPRAPTHFCCQVMLEMCRAWLAKPWQFIRSWMDSKLNLLKVDQKKASLLKALVIMLLMQKIKLNKFTFFCL